MSKLTSNLANELSDIFGSSFGNDVKSKQTLSESVEQAIQERRDGTKQPPERRMFGKEREAFGKKFNAKQDKNIKKNLDDFHSFANKEGEKSSGKARPSALKGRDKTPWKHAGATAQASSGKGRHNPFRKSSNLGTGPGTPPGHKGTGPRHHDQVKCWHCQCGNIYTKGCQCTGTGATKDCPKGHVKHVGIKYKYRQDYNKMYHKFRGEKRASGDGVTAKLAARGHR